MGNPWALQILVDSNSHQLRPAQPMIRGMMGFAVQQPSGEPQPSPPCSKGTGYYAPLVPAPLLAVKCIWNAAYYRRRRRRNVLSEQQSKKEVTAMYLVSASQSLQKLYLQISTKMGRKRYQSVCTYAFMCHGGILRGNLEKLLTQRELLHDQSS